jgi:hypothetical protein
MILSITSIIGLIQYSKSDSLSSLDSRLDLVSNIFTIVSMLLFVYFGLMTFLKFNRTTSKLFYATKMISLIFYIIMQCYSIHSNFIDGLGRWEARSLVLIFFFRFAYDFLTCWILLSVCHWINIKRNDVISHGFKRDSMYFQEILTTESQIIKDRFKNNQTVCEKKRVIFASPIPV